MVMQTSRRDFLKTSLYAAGLAASWPSVLLAQDQKKGIYWSAFATNDQSYGMAILDAKGRILAEQKLPDRGHGAAVSIEHHHMALTERRPGWYGQVWDMELGSQIAELSLPEGRHFYGHGVYYGSYLYTTESVYDDERGIIGVWDVTQGYKRIAEFDAGGIGPHELRITADGQALVIAAGGILTHPDEGRSKLNLSDMTPKLVWINRVNGDITRVWEPDAKWHKASIRHLALNGQGDVFFGMQYQGSRRERAPLFGIAYRNDETVISDIPKDVHKASQNYCGSVELDGTGKIAAASTPRGNNILFFDAESATYIGHVVLSDACGVIGLNHETGKFLITSGQGGIYHHDSLSGKTKLLAQTNKQWDNHITRLV